MQTELIAIIMSLQYLNTNPDWSSIVIHTDSLSALQALQNHESKNELVISCYNIAKIIKEKGKHITLHYIPSHIGLIGNEEADKAAKEAAMKDTIDIRISQSIDCYKSKCLHFLKSQNYPSDYEIKNSASLSWWCNINNKVAIIDKRIGRKKQVLLYRLKLGYKTYNEIVKKNEFQICQYCNDITLESLVHYVTECPCTSHIFTNETNTKVGINDRRKEAAIKVNNLFASHQNIEDIILKFPPPYSSKQYAGIHQCI